MLLFNKDNYLTVVRSLVALIWNQCSVILKHLLDINVLYNLVKRKASFKGCVRYIFASLLLGLN